MVKVCLQKEIKCLCWNIQILFVLFSNTAQDILPLICFGCLAFSLLKLLLRSNLSHRTFLITLYLIKVLKIESKLLFLPVFQIDQVFKDLWLVFSVIPLSTFFYNLHKLDTYPLNLSIDLVTDTTNHLLSLLQY